METPQKASKPVQRVPEDQESYTDDYYRFREDILTRQLSNSENYDKILLALSSSGIGFSFAFLQFMSPIQNIAYLWFLKLSWIFFILCILITIAAYKIGNIALNFELEMAKKYLLDNDAEARDTINKWSRVNNLLNYATGICFICAILSLTIFIWINTENLVGENHMSENNPNQPIKKSADVPRISQLPNREITSINESADVPSIQQIRPTPKPKPNTEQSSDQ